MQLAPAKKAERTVGPTIELVSLAEAKKQVEVAGSDHDDHLTRLIQSAREQWEADTERYPAQQTWQLKLDRFMELQFSERPVASISSVTYYDGGNAAQTLASSVYSLDTARNVFRLADSDQTFPTTYGRWDAVTIEFIVGNVTDVANVPARDKQAVLLLVGFYFENRDMLMSDALQQCRPYKALASQAMRASYP